MNESRDETIDRGEGERRPGVVDPSCKRSNRGSKVWRKWFNTNHENSRSRQPNRISPEDCLESSTGAFSLRGGETDFDEGFSGSDGRTWGDSSSSSEGEGFGFVEGGSRSANSQIDYSHCIRPSTIRHMLFYDAGESGRAVAAASPDRDHPRRKKSISSSSTAAGRFKSDVSAGGGGGSWPRRKSCSLHRTSTSHKSLKNSRFSAELLSVHKVDYLQYSGAAASKPNHSNSLPKYLMGDKKLRATQPPASGVDGATFRKRTQNMTRWFREFDDQQKNILLKKILEQCDLPQMHLLSVALDKVGGPHKTCPHNCQDLLSWLPQRLTFDILGYLDPVSLSRCSQVSRRWRQLANEPALWRRFCRTSKWQLSPAGEHKQIINHMMAPHTHWKQVFGKSYRLHQNWLKGRCNVRTYKGHTEGISCVQFDDTRIVSGSSDKSIKVWNIRTDTPWSVLTLVGHSGTVRCLHLEANRLVSGSTDTTIKVWDLSVQSSWSSIACRMTMTGHSNTVRCLQVDDEKVISGSYDQTIKIWDIRNGQCKLTLRGHSAAVLCLQFDEHKLVSGSADKTIKVWDLVRGQCVMTFEGHHDAVTCLQFDRKQVVSGSLDSDIKFWDLHSGQCVGTLDWTKSEGHTGAIRCLQADRWRVVTAADDKTLKVWDTETRLRLLTLRHHTDGVTCLQFNDSMIVSGSYDKTVKLWDFSAPTGPTPYLGQE